MSTTRLATWRWSHAASRRRLEALRDHQTPAASRVGSAVDARDGGHPVPGVAQGVRPAPAASSPEGPPAPRPPTPPEQPRQPPRGRRLRRAVAGGVLATLLAAAVAAAVALAPTSAGGPGPEPTPGPPVTTPQRRRHSVDPRRNVPGRPTGNPDDFARGRAAARAAALAAAERADRNGGAGGGGQPPRKGCRLLTLTLLLPALILAPALLPLAAFAAVTLWLAKPEPKSGPLGHRHKDPKHKDGEWHPDRDAGAEPSRRHTAGTPDDELDIRPIGRRAQKGQ